MSLECNKIFEFGDIIKYNTKSGKEKLGIFIEYTNDKLRNFGFKCLYVDDNYKNNLPFNDDNKFLYLENSINEYYYNTVKPIIIDSLNDDDKNALLTKLNTEKMMKAFKHSSNNIISKGSIIKVNDRLIFGLLINDNDILRGYLINKDGSLDYTKVIGITNTGKIIYSNLNEGITKMNCINLMSLDYYKKCLYEYYNSLSSIKRNIVTNKERTEAIVGDIVKWRNTLYVICSLGESVMQSVQIKESDNSNFDFMYNNNYYKCIKEFPFRNNNTYKIIGNIGLLVHNCNKIEDYLNRSLVVEDHGIQDDIDAKEKKIGSKIARRLHK